MFVNILKSKIHNALVTDAHIHYSGSITIDKFLMEKANLIPYEKVLVVSLDSGERLETYVIEGKYKSSEIIINGAAARKILKGQRIIIMAFTWLDLKDAKKFKPSIIILDELNQIVKESLKKSAEDEC